MVTDTDVFEVLDKLSDYEQLLIELCAVIQDGHILLSRAQYDAGMIIVYLFHDYVVFTAHFSPNNSSHMDITMCLGSSPENLVV